MSGIPAHVDTVIVGTGFAGLCAAIQLIESGRDDVLLVERGSDVGGTWRDNSYPGCACDVPSHLYSFSFAPNPDWHHAFSRQPQIFDYLRKVAADHGLPDRTRFNTDLQQATWDESSACWQVDTSAGPLTARHLVLGVGPLSEPKLPDVPGLESFAGTTFHSATWDHDHDLRGRRVAVIGTGASAIQFVPHVQRVADQLTLFQRTAPWVLPRRDRPYRAVERRLNRILPGVQRAIRLRMYLLRELWLIGFVVRPSIMAQAEKVARRRLAAQVSEPELREKLTPTYRLGCKRVLLSNDYYPALTQPNASVVTDRIVGITPRGVQTEDGNGKRTEHAVDTIIFGTGFHVTDPPIASRIHGRDGRTMAEHWADTGMAALHGVTVAGFPNLAMLVGPNTGLGHTSIVLMIEAQVNYLLSLRDQAERNGITACEPNPGAQRQHNQWIQQQLEGTVWNDGGCASWYLDEQGRNTTLWPTFTWRFMRQLRHADLGEYDVIPGDPAAHPAREAVAVRDMVQA